MEQNYIPPMRMTQPTTTSSTPAYSQVVSSSPALYQSKTVPEANASQRRPELPSTTSADSSYRSSYKRTSNPYEPTQNVPYTMATGQTIPSISGLTQSPLPSPHLGSAPGSGALSQYNTNLSRSVAEAVDSGLRTMLTGPRSPGLYDSGVYSQQPYTTGAPAPAPLYSSPQPLSYPPPFVGSSVNEVLAKPLGSESSIRVLNQRPKPQCWEHGCNGRQFSTFSNLLRHQREKSGTAAKSYCPKCGAEFTRTTARNGHLAHDKCSKQRRTSDDK
jgi:hypothetical protein